MALGPCERCLTKKLSCEFIPVSDDPQHIQGLPFNPGASSTMVNYSVSLFKFNCWVAPYGTRSQTDGGAEGNESIQPGSHTYFGHMILGEAEWVVHDSRFCVRTTDATFFTAAWREDTSSTPDTIQPKPPARRLLVHGHPFTQLRVLHLRETMCKR